MIGDQSDFATRIKALLPSEWFGVSPNLDAAIQGPASVLAAAYSQIAFAGQQTRLATASGAFLDIIAYDFFGGDLPRNTGESDVAYLARIKANLFAKGPTRADMVKVITLVTGNAPVVIEPSNTNDCGAWDAPTSAWDESSRWGDTLPYQALLIVKRPGNSGIPNILGWDTAGWGWDVAAQEEWTDAGMISGLTDAAILAAINATTPLGVTVWVQLQ